MSRLLLGLVLLGSIGCNRDPSDQIETLRNLPNQPGGNPLIPSVALYPWPSDLYLVDDASTVTGQRLELPPEAVPNDIDPADYAHHDGFTRAPHLLAWFPEGIDPATLPGIGSSVLPDSPVVVVEADSTTPIPVLAELDAQTTDIGDQALILRPQIALAPGTRHVVLLRDGLKGAAGEQLTPTDAFRALRDQIPTDNDAVEAQRQDFTAVRGAIDALGLDPEEVVLGWTFTTRSSEQVIGPTLSMHDQQMAETLGDWVLVSDTHDGANRLIEGEIEVLDFLGPSGRITLDDSGDPVASGLRTIRFLVTIPDTVTETRPMFAFGHGFFSSYDETTWSSLQGSIQPWQMSTISTNFIGFNDDEAVQTAAKIGMGIGGLAEISDQQLQSHVHFTALARLTREQLAADIVEDRGQGAFNPLDAGAVHYMGISNGGTQGAVILAGSPALDRGALVVPGGAWSHMMQRAVQWGTMGSLLADRYPGKRDLQVVLALAQQLLDPVDALNYAEGLTDQPFEGRGPNEVTLHMAVGDAQVANLVTEWVARSAGIPVIAPSGREIPLIDEVSATPPGGYAGSSALYVYDEGYPPLPEGNQAPDSDNGAHETIRQLDSYSQQVKAFLEDGTIVQVCDGACDPG